MHAHCWQPCETKIVPKQLPFEAVPKSELFFFISSEEWSNVLIIEERERGGPQCIPQSILAQGVYHVKTKAPRRVLCCALRYHASKS